MVETSGTFSADSSGQENHGDFQGSADFSTNVTTGILGQAIVIDGTDDIVEVPDHDSLTFSDGADDQPFSISIWMNADDASLGAGIFGKANDVAVGEYYFLMAGGDLFFRIADDTSAAYKGIRLNSFINDDTWYHIVGTYDGSELQAGIKNLEPQLPCSQKRHPSTFLDRCLVGPK